jgi:tight adherence protein C
MVYAALGGVLLAMLGFSLPRLYVTLRAQDRSREIERGLPVFADMLSIALLAGQGLTGALRQVTAQLRNAFPRMADELDIVIKQTDMLSLNVAFEQWANRCQLTEVRNLSVILTQSQRLGNDVSTALMEFSTNLRGEARQRADAKAQRASFWMLFPTILCLWVPGIVILVAPVYYEFSTRRARAKDVVPQITPGSPGSEHFRFNNKAPAKQ